MFENADLMTAIITPFDDQGAIDYEALAEITEMLLAKGNRGFVIGGTTGETPTLTHAEKIELYTKFAEMVAGRAPVIAGAGSNNTLETAEFTKEVAQIPGVDAALIVVPYYNKPNQRGMIAHYEAIAEMAKFPLVIYNIPGRTGVTMNNDTVLKLAENPYIVGVKQCTSIEDLEFLVDHAPADFAIYSGEDAQALSAKVMGARGIISVASHIYCQDMRNMYDALNEGNYQQAGQYQRALTPKMAALFMYPSPSPVKAIMTLQGYQVGNPRLPILPLTAGETQNLLEHLGLNEAVSQGHLSREVTV
ncbi:4-hydroxy-tetrahydrodipicolinate synthase [Leuconostocaceae bacterium ESL0723]|nr:4-hydroxy-tetrahydrodipicolinate synthase [Lactobacillaceae bacterium L1_55_11]WEV54212.1 4-hydroxy-tetrahydrodipicolinate synthase [Leuconostocaceae bacterium ESL0723]